MKGPAPAETQKPPQESSLHAGFLAAKQNAHNWEQAAGQYSRNADWYRSLLEEIGNMELFRYGTHHDDLGKEHPEVLIAKVVETVRACIGMLVTQRDHAYCERTKAYEDASKALAERDEARRQAAASPTMLEDLKMALEKSRKQVEAITEDRRRIVGELQDTQDLLAKHPVEFISQKSFDLDARRGVLKRMTLDKVKELKALCAARGTCLSRIRRILKWLDHDRNLVALAKYANRQNMHGVNLEELVEDILNFPEGVNAKCVEAEIAAGRTTESI